MSLNDGDKEVGKWRKYKTFAAGTDGRTDGVVDSVCGVRA